MKLVEKKKKGEKKTAAIVFIFYIKFFKNLHLFYYDHSFFFSILESNCCKYVKIYNLM